MTIVMIGPLAPLEAKTRKGDKYLAEGRAHEEKKEWDAALEAYEKALSEDPTELTYQMAAQKGRFEASAMHLANGQKVRAQGQLGEALLEFQKAYALSPSTTAAEQEILNTQQMIQRERLRVEQTGKEAAPEVRGLTPSEQAKKEAEDRVNRLLPAPELKPPRPARQDFKINGTTSKTIFDTIALSAGLNPPLYDPDFLTNNNKDKLDIAINNLTVEEALDYVALKTHSYWRPVNDTTIFVTLDNQNKRRDYEEEITRIFYLTNITTNADLTSMVTVVRTIADIQRLMPFEPQNAIIAKGTADKMALAEKIIHDLDKPRSEVVIDVYVVEASSVYMRSLAAGPFTTGVNLSGNFDPRTSIQVQQASTTTTTSTTTSNQTNSITNPTGITNQTTTPGSTTSGQAIPFSHIGQVNAGDWSTVLPSAVFTATLSDTRTKVLQSPQLRCVDNGKATMKIGEKEPTASGSFQPGLGGVAGAGISPLVNTQFTYLDVGVNVEVQPRIHDNGDVSMHISIDISSVTGQVNLGGINEPIIGQRKVDQEVRLRDGEVSLIGGLLNVQDNNVKTGVPGLSSVPFLGKLFSGNSVDRERDEIMIALIPHIVRRPDITAENIRGVASGTQQTVTVHRAPRAQEPVVPAPAQNSPGPGGDNAAAMPIAPPAATPQPSGILVPGLTSATPPMASPPVAPPAEPSALAPPATAPPETPAAPPANRPGAGGPARINFDQAQIDKNAGEAFSVSIPVEDARDVSSAQFIFQYDPKIMSLDDVTLGKFWLGDSDEPILIKNVQNEGGLASVKINRKPGSASISGTGTMLTLKFKAVGKGTGTLSANTISLNNAQNQMVGTGTPKITVNVK